MEPLRSIEQVFDTTNMKLERAGTPRNIEGLSKALGRTVPVSLARDRTLPMSGPVEHLFSERGLPRGWVVEITGGPGATSLGLAVVAGPSRTGSWVACVGFPQLGWEAAEEVGLDLDHVVAVHTPPREWAKVVAALLDAFDVVLCGPEVFPTATQLRGLRARARERGSVLVAVHGSLTRAPDGRDGPGWPEADARLRVEHCEWHGLGEGWGHLGPRRLSLVVSGRGSLSRTRREEVHLAPDGRAVKPEPTGAAGTESTGAAGTVAPAATLERVG